MTKKPMGFDPTSTVYQVGSVNRIINFQIRVLAVTKIKQTSKECLFSYISTQYTMVSTNIY